MSHSSYTPPDWYQFQTNTLRSSSCKTFTSLVMFQAVFTPHIPHVFHGLSKCAHGSSPK